MRKPKVIRFSDLPKPEPIDTSQALPAAELSLRRILEEEPKILDALAELERTPDGPLFKRWRAFEANHGVTPTTYLGGLVGWHARNPKLRSEAAYEMVISQMWDLLL
jgi:hypothetical protein